MEVGKSRFAIKSVPRQDLYRREGQRSSLLHQGAELLQFLGVLAILHQDELKYWLICPYTVKKEMKCSGKSRYYTKWFVILLKIVCDTSQNLEKHELIRIVKQTISCSISESLLHLISFLTVYFSTRSGATQPILQIFIVQNI